MPDDLPYYWPVRSEAVIAAEQRKAENEVRRQQRALEQMRLEAERKPGDGAAAPPRRRGRRGGGTAAEELAQRSGPFRLDDLSLGPVDAGKRVAGLGPVASVLP